MSRNTNASLRREALETALEDAERHLQLLTRDRVPGGALGHGRSETDSRAIVQLLEAKTKDLRATLVKLENDEKQAHVGRRPYSTKSRRKVPLFGAFALDPRALRSRIGWIRRAERDDSQPGTP